MAENIDVAPMPGSVTTMPARNAYLVHSADHALKLLQHIVEHRAMRVTEAARHLKVAPSTAHRLLTTLYHHGFVSQDRRGGPYRPGHALIELASAAAADRDIRTAARPALQQLRETVRETVSLMVLDGRQVRFVESIEGPQPVRVASRLGYLGPAHRLSGGKAMLAALPVVELEGWYRTTNGATAGSAPGSSGAGSGDGASAPATDREPSWDALLAELEATRHRGYGVNLCDKQGISGIGAAIFGPAGRPLAAISLACPESRLATVEQAAALAPALLEATSAIEQDMKRSLSAARSESSPR